MKLVIPLHSLYWSIHTKDESKHGTAYGSVLDCQSMGPRFNLCDLPCMIHWDFCRTAASSCAMSTLCHICCVGSHLYQANACTGVTLNFLVYPLEMQWLGLSCKNSWCLILKNVVKKFAQTGWAQMVLSKIVCFDDQSSSTAFWCLMKVKNTSEPAEEVHHSQIHFMWMMKAVWWHSLPYIWITQIEWHGTKVDFLIDETSSVIPSLLSNCSGISHVCLLHLGLWEIACNLKVDRTANHTSWKKKCMAKFLFNFITAVSINMNLLAQRVVKFSSRAWLKLHSETHLNKPYR